MSEGYRRIYYDIETGNKITEIAFSGDFVHETIEQDISKFSVLSERNRETFDVLELPFGAYAQDFAECGGYKVNPTTKELEFAPKPTTPEEPLVFDKPFSVQIAELKTENVALKADNEALKSRDAGLADDVVFIMDTLMENNLIILE